VAHRPGQLVDSLFEAVEYEQGPILN